MMGTLIVDERIYPIARITLDGGKIHFWVGPLTAPVNLPECSEVRVHAPDGSLILTALWQLPRWDVERLRIAHVSDTITLDLPLKIDEVVGWPAEAV